jgi:pimeloyl-ACP methyl ester carboxylesterase
LATPTRASRVGTNQLEALMSDRHVTSNDGTRIAYEMAGSGPAVILVGGGLTDRTKNAPLVPVLAPHFTVINYDRRGRGMSTDAAPYAVAREVEDIGALVDAIGGMAYLFGVSSGGALALEAAMTIRGVVKVGVYEVPWNLDADWPGAWGGYVDQLDRALAEHDRGTAFEAFLRVTGMPEEQIAGMRAAPFWADVEAIAHTLAYDAACLGDGQPPMDRLATIRQPVLVLTGDDRSAESPRWVLALDNAAEAIASAIPGGERDILVGQSHVPEPGVVADRLVRFFRE